MNENELKNGSVENNSYQKSSKAEKILAIKRALQTGNMNAEERLSDIISDIAPVMIVLVTSRPLKMNGKEK